MTDEQKTELKQKVEEALDLVRPALEMDGGNVELVDITDDMIAQLVMLGHCGNCPMSQMTLKMGIERAIRQRVPEIQGVDAVPPEASLSY